MFPVHPSVNRNAVSPEVFKRKLVRAIDQGIQIRHTSDGRSFATSRSRPDLLHETSHAGCSCEDFFYTGSCSHQALAVAEIVLTAVTAI